MKHPIKKLQSILLAAIVTTSSSAVLRASSVTATWKTESGDFTNTENWSTGTVPGAANTILFTGSKPLKIDISSPNAVMAMDVQTSSTGTVPDLTLNLAGGSLKIGDESVNQGIFFRLNSSSQSGPRTVAITGGTLFCPVVSISTNPAAGNPPSKILVTEKGRFETSRYLYVGNKGEGILEITGEGTVECRGFLRVAEGDDSKGTIRMSGPQALLVCGSIEAPRWGLAFIGGRGEGRLEVLDGARVEGLLIQAARNSSEAPTGLPKGFITVSGKGSSIACEQLFIGGGRVNLQRANAPVRDGTGELRVSKGGTVAAAELRIFSDSTLAIDSQSSLSVTPPRTASSPVAVLEPGSTFHLLLDSPATKAPVQVAGTIDLNGAKLLLSSPETGASPSGTIPLIDYSGGNLAGTFDSLPDGATVTAPDGKSYTIDYGLNGSRIVTLKSK